MGEAKESRRVLLTGATGFVGREVLARLDLEPSVGAVTCLARREVPVASAKVRTIVPSSFEHYDDPELRDYDACIWTLGGKASDESNPEHYARITHDFTLALARHLSATKRPFTFCYLSGMGADPAERAWLPWEKTTRHLKGRTERDLQALETANFKVACFRPGGIVASGARTRRALGFMTVTVDEIARALVKVALERTALGVITNREVQKLGATR